MDDWRQILRDEHAKRLSEIEENEIRYAINSDRGLICQLVRELDREERFFSEWREKYTPWWLRIIQSRPRHAYTCRLFKRVDYLLLWLRFKKPHWHEGYLIVGHFEAGSIFPLSWYHWAAEQQNKRIWTRLIFDL